VFVGAVFVFIGALFVLVGTVSVIFGALFEIVGTVFTIIGALFALGGTVFVVVGALFVFIGQFFFTNGALCNNFLFSNTMCPITGRQRILRLARTATEKVAVSPAACPPLRHFRPVGITYLASFAEASAKVSARMCTYDNAARFTRKLIRFAKLKQWVYALLPFSRTIFFIFESYAGLR
jgi:hypothetical protein